MKKRRWTPKERLAAHLQAFGYNVEPEDIRHVHGGKHKTLNDILEYWSVAVNGVEIQGGDTVSKCAKGIVLEKNTPETCLYGDFVAYPVKKSGVDKITQRSIIKP